MKRIAKTPATPVVKSLSCSWMNGEGNGGRDRHRLSIGTGAVSGIPADGSQRLLDAQDLGERRAPDLELLLGRLARAEHALELVPGRRRARARRGRAVALGPREDLDGERRARRARPRACAAGPGRSTTRAQQRGAGEVRGQQRRHQVRAAAVVLLGGVAASASSVLVGARSPCARRRGRPRGRRRAGRRVDGSDDSARPARSRRPRPRIAPAQHACRRAPRRPSRRAPRVLEGQLRLGQRALDERDDGDRLAEAHDAAQRRRRVSTRRAGAACGPRRPRSSPSRRRTAAAQCVGPCTSRPLRSAMPPRRSFWLSIERHRASPC